MEPISSEILSCCVHTVLPGHFYTLGKKHKTTLLKLSLAASTHVFTHLHRPASVPKEGLYFLNTRKTLEQKSLNCRLQCNSRYQGAFPALLDSRKWLPSVIPGSHMTLHVAVY